MKILYTTDGFEPAIGAGQLLESFANRDRVEITVMSVTHSGLPNLRHLAVTLDPAESRREDTVKIVDAAAERLTSAGFKAGTHTAEGHPGDEIVRALAEGGYGAVVLGSGRRTWLGKRLLGSVSTHVLHSAPCSVLVVHEAAPNEGPGRVLVGTDGSAGADETIETFGALAAPDRVEITVISVVQPYASTVFPVLGRASTPLESAGQTDAIQQQIRAQAEEAAEDAAGKLRSMGFTTEIQLPSGNPTEQLLKHADEGAYDLVAVGSRGHGSVRRAVLGSVSDQVARHCRASLIGRRPDQ